MAIRVELNEFKMKEMSVHNESRKNTLFYDVGTSSFYQKNRVHTEIHGPKPIGPGPNGSVLENFKKSRTSSDQGRQNFENLGPI